VLAVYQGGVLRPAHPLPLAEGETVEVTVSETPSALREWERRLRAAKTFQEWVEIANTAPVPDDGYDVLEALNENRIRNGERPLIPPTEREVAE
jgi:predicted DNA-binding antitoxin AbrB/MazE fold protein